MLACLLVLKLAFMSVSGGVEPFSLSLVFFCYKKRILRIRRDNEEQEYAWI